MTSSWSVEVESQAQADPVRDTLGHVPEREIWIKIRILFVPPIPKIAASAGQFLSLVVVLDFTREAAFSFSAPPQSALPGRWRSGSTFRHWSQAPPVPLFKATFTDWNNLGPKLLPDVITGVTVLSGQGGAGSTRRINYTSAVPFGFVTERLDSIDHDKLELWISLVEGGDIGRKLESASSHIKVEGKGDGSVVKLEVTHKVLPGEDISEEVEKVKKSFIRSIKAVEEYLLANPGIYA